MSIYAIGDIQGCLDELLRLLDAIRFDEGRDQIWFAGDLVNRGPKSLETLRFVKSLGNSAITVLGNHDLHLLATAFQIRPKRKKDSLTQILESPDRDELLDWLRRQPLLHRNEDFCLIHAGLPPQWGLDFAEEMAREVESILRGPNFHLLLKTMYGNKPNLWSSDLKNSERLRFIINCFTRIRYCDDHGRLDFNHSGPVGSQPKGLKPWYTLPNRKNAKGTPIVFGHWSTLGYYHGHNVYCIDSGCLWGGSLTALHLGKNVYRVSIDCPALGNLHK